MSFANIIKLATQNIIGYKKMFIRIFISVTIILVLSSSAMHIISSMQSAMQDITQTELHTAFLHIMDRDLKYGIEISNEKKEHFISLCSKTDDIADITVKTNYWYFDTEQLYSDNDTSINISFDSGDIYNLEKSSYFEPVAIDLNYSTFHRTNENSINKEKPHLTRYLYGREIAADNEIMIPDSFLKELGIKKEEMASIVGKNITITDVTGEIVFLDNITVVGIYDSSFGHNDEIDNSLYISSGYAVTTQCLPSYRETQITFNSFNGCKNALELCEKEGINCSESFQLIYYFWLEKIVIFGRELMALILPLIYVVMLLSLFSALYFYHLDAIKRNSLLRVLGAKRKSVNLITLTELLVISLFSAITGFGLSLLTNLLVAKIAENKIYRVFSVVSTEYFTTFAVTIVGVYLFCVISSLVITHSKKLTAKAITVRAR